MASYNADIRIGVTGKTQLNQLEAQLTRTQKQLNKLNKSVNLKGKVQTIKLETRGAEAQIRKLEERIKGLGRTVTINLRTNETAGKGRTSGGSGNAAGAVLSATAASRVASAGFAGQTRSLEEMRSLAGQIKKEFNGVKTASIANEAAANEVKQAYEQQLGVLSRIKGREDEIKNATIARNAALGQQKSLQTRLEKGLIKNVAAVKNAKIEAAQFGSNASDWNSKISAAQASVRGLNKELEKTNQLAKGFSNTRMRAPDVPKRKPAAPAAAAAKKGGGAALLGGSIKSVLGLGAAYVALNTAVRSVNKSIQVASDTKSVELRMKALSAEFDNYADVVAVVERAQEKFNVGNLAASQGISQLYGRLRPLGLTLEEIETVYSGFSTAVTLTGATAKESAGALLQLTQALGAGALRGQEFNSVAEQAPGVLRAIAKELDVPVGKLKQLAKDGKLTSDVLVKALKRVETEGADALSAALDTPAQKFQTLQNRTEKLNKAFGDLILPAVISGVEGLTTVAENATTEIDKTSLAVATLDSWLNKFKNLVPKIEEGGGRIGKAFRFVGEMAKSSANLLNPYIGLLKTFSNLFNALVDATPNKFKDDGFIGPPVPPTPPESLRTRLGLGEEEEEGSGSGKGSSAAPRKSRLPELASELQYLKDLQAIEQQRVAMSEREATLRDFELTGLEIERSLEKDIRDINLGDAPVAEKLADIANVQVAATTELLALKNDMAEFNRQELVDNEAILRDLDGAIALEKVYTDEKRIQLETALAIAAVEADGSKGSGQKKAEINKLKELEEARLFNADPINAYMTQLKTGLADTRQQVTDLARTIESELATAMSSAITGLIDGTTTVQEAFGSMFANIGKAFIDMATQMLAQKAILSLLSAFTGGRGMGGGGGYFDKMTGLGTAGPNFGLATGGKAEGGQPYTVGEAGPELFIPGVTGTVTSNDQFEAARNALSSGEVSSSSSGGDDALGSVSNSFSQNSSVLATTSSLIRENAIRSEEKTMMGGSGTVVIETQVINNVEYASVEQVQKASAAATKQARAQVFSDLRNKPASRAQIGMR